MHMLKQGNRHDQQRFDPMTVTEENKAKAAFDRLALAGRFADFSLREDASTSVDVPFWSHTLMLGTKNEHE